LALRYQRLRHNSIANIGLSAIEAEMIQCGARFAGQSGQSQTNAIQTLAAFADRFDAEILPATINSQQRAIGCLCITRCSAENVRAE
jgi:hypothetical protein